MIYVGKCLAGVETLVQSPVYRMDAKKTPATKAADVTAPRSVPRDTCILAILKSIFTQEELILALLACAAIVT